MFISIVIPTYNCGHLISDAIESCIKQSYKKYEIIVVNDGSNDSTDHALRRYAKYILYIKQKNLGVSLARNNGAHAAKGEWLLFLDADDILLENALKIFFDCAYNSNAGVIFGKTIEYDTRNNLVRRYNKSIEGCPPIPAKKNFLKSLIVTPGAALVKREIFERVGGFKLGLHPSEDRHFWLKCGTITGFKGCDQDIVLKRTQEKSASLDINRIIYKGFLVQLDFISWCYENNIDSSFIEHSKYEIVDLNITKAVEERSWLAFEAIILHAKFCNILSDRVSAIYKFSFFIKLFPSFINKKIIRLIFSNEQKRA